MKFSTSVIVAALAQTSSAQCNIQSGQISVIEPLVAAWKLYNKQVAFNAVVDEKIANATDAKNAKDTEISSFHAGQATTHGTAKTNSETAINQDFDDAKTALGNKLTTAQGDIETTYQNALQAAQTKHDNRQDEVDAAIAVLQEKQTNSTANDVLLNAEVARIAGERRTAANAAAVLEKAGIANATAAKLAHVDVHDAAIRVRYNAKHDQAVDDLNAKYANIDSEIEGTKYNVNATLSVLDNAGSAGGVDYAANCIVPVATAIEQVKEEKSPTQIWYNVVVSSDGAEARGAVTPEPTNAPTDQPTNAPTDQPTTAQPTAQPTNQPTTAQPTAQPTDALTQLQQIIVDNGWRNEENARILDANGQRNTIISGLSNERADWSTSELQGLSNDELLKVVNREWDVCVSHMHGPAFSAGVSSDFPPANCVDGNEDNLCHGALPTRWQWFRAHQAEPGMIKSVEIINRKDCCRDRLGYHEIRVGGGHDGPRVAGNAFIGSAQADANTVSTSFSNMDKRQSGQYVFLQLSNDVDRYLNFAEMKVKHLCDTNKYQAAFVATGCKNSNVNTNWWRTISHAGVMYDMYSYCDKVNSGIASQGQIDVCCGGEPNCGQGQLTCVPQPTSALWAA